MRVGNGAWDQIQLDVYGELLNTLYLYREQLGELHPEIQRSSPTSPTPPRERWRERDAGMWEMRGEPLHHLSSKVLCWTALDRAVKLAPALGEYAKAEAWAEERDRIRAAILERGWSEKRQAYAQSFDSDELDAAALLMPLLGFLPADDPRMRSTIEAIARELTEDGLVLRYRNAGGPQRRRPDGRGGHLRDLLVLARVVRSRMAGELDRAQELFDQLAGYANDLGLLAEEIDTAQRRAARQLPAGLQPHRPDHVARRRSTAPGAER